VLACALIVVVAYAWHDVSSRRARKSWDHTLALRARTPALERRLEGGSRGWLAVGPDTAREIGWLSQEK
jgi:hypothetical protein